MLAISVFGFLICRHIENETAADEGEVGREGVRKVKLPILL